MNIALIGPPGVGKGTHASKLVDKFDLRHLVTGELFRKNLAKRAAIGLLARRYINQGELVPDEVVDAMVEAWLWRVDRRQGILFDGFPRTINQAEFLDRLFKKELDRHLNAIIYLDVSEADLIQRLSNRILCRNCQTPYHLIFNPPVSEGICDICGGDLYQRPDDIPEMARVRLRSFNRVIQPLLEYYQASNRLIIIDGSAEIDQVSQTIIKAVKAVKRGEIPAATPEAVAQIATLKAITPVIPEITAQSLNLILLGGPGSGKGTQADQLKNEFNLQHISTGELFRENLKNETDLGKLAKTYMDQGELVPDDVTEAIVEERLARPDTQTGFILDGFPRTLPQAEALSYMTRNMKRQIDGVLYLKVSDEEIIERLSGRLICRECQATFHKKFKPFQTCPANKCQAEHLYQRDDDQPETVRARLKTFHTQTAPLIAYYRDADLLVEVDGEGDVEEVTKRVLAAARGVRVS